MSNKGTRRSGGPSVAAGLPGREPSPEAQSLAQASQTRDLPAGRWHVSDWAVERMAGAPTTVVEAVHETGGTFRLLLGQDGQVLGFSPGDDDLIALWYGDPTAWARSQRWRVAAPDGGDPPTEGG